jgi:hypothetical protein
MLRRAPKLSFVVLLALALPLSSTLGCESKQDDKKVEEVKELPKPINGGPIAAELVEFVGEGESRGMKIRLYNHDESKTLVGMMLLFRYKDASGNLLKVKVGTPFEDDTDFTSLSGNRFKCEPKKNATFELEGEMLAVPKDAASAEVLVSSARSLAADGQTIEDWWSQENFGEWPAG